MKKDMIFSVLLTVVGIMLFLLKATGLGAHIAISVLGIIILAAYTITCKKEWKIPAAEIVMRACYGIALISGVVVMKAASVAAIAIVHKVSAAIFVILLAGLAVHKLRMAK